MALIYSTVSRPKVLHVHLVGEFSLASAKRHFLEIMSALETHRNDKVLIDGREVVGNPEIIERFYYGDFVANIVNQQREASASRKNPQFAYVLQEPVLDPQRLGETVAVNRGMNTKAFDNMEDAIEWLGLKPEDLFDP